MSKAATRSNRSSTRWTKRLLIGGEWRDASGGETFAVEDPSTGETLCEVADATPDDARAALDAAVAAQAEWARERRRTTAPRSSTPPSS